jgi:2-keto-4-pentenoate hydratase
MKPTTKPVLAALALCITLLPALAQAACPSDLEAAAVASAIVARQPVPQPAGTLSMADGLCGRDKVVRYLAQAYGESVGYKAGLTNPAVQQRFKYDAPLRGTLFKSMLTTDGAELLAAFGTRPVFEADLIVEVADPVALARAETPLAALRALRSYAPYIELPDLMVAGPSALGGPMLAMVNVGARAGVVGKAIPVKATQELADAFASMTVSLTDGNGAGQHKARAARQPAQCRDLAGPRSGRRHAAQARRSAVAGLIPKLLAVGLAVKATYEGLPASPG